MAAYDDSRLNALYAALLKALGSSKPGEQPTVRLNLIPINIPGPEAYEHYRGMDLSDADVARLLAALGEAQPETVVDWAAGAFAGRHPELAADLTELFTSLDPREMNRTVLDHRQVDMPRAIRALDDVFGEIVDPYADEDDA